MMEYSKLYLLFSTLFFITSIIKEDLFFLMPAGLFILASAVALLAETKQQDMNFRLKILGREIERERFEAIHDELKQINKKLGKKKR